VKLCDVELMTGDKPLPRTSASQSKTLNCTTSHNSLATTARVTDSHRSSTVSAISTTSTATVQPKNQEEAVLKTMRSLEGARRLERTKSRDALNNVKRPAPSPPRPRSLDAKADNETKVAKEDPRRSLGIERTLAALKEESPAKLAVPSPCGLCKLRPVEPHSRQLAWRLLRCLRPERVPGKDSQLWLRRRDLG
jgi:hypothetical protein